MSEGCDREVVSKAVTEPAGVWRSLGIPILLTLVVALAALACIDSEPVEVAPTAPPALPVPTTAPVLTAPALSEAQAAATAAVTYS